LEERFIYGEFDCFLGVGDKDSLKEDDLVDKAAGDGFALFWKAVALPVVKALSYFWE